MPFWPFRKKVPGPAAEPPAPAAEPPVPAAEPGVDENGNAMIIPGTAEIPDKWFRRRKDLRRVVLPDSVRKIDSWAFCGCENLCSVELNEGLENIGDYAFDNCSSLHKITMPDSLKQLGLHNFERSEPDEPIYNRSGTTLYRFPKSLTTNPLVLPRGLRTIAPGAFADNFRLKEIVLPDTLEEISGIAFCRTWLRKITIPASVRKIRSGAFRNCDMLEAVDFLCPSAAAEDAAFSSKRAPRLTAGGQPLDFMEELRILGLPLCVVPAKLTVPRGDYETSPAFLSLAGACASGDTGAMMAFADYFENLNSSEFFRYAANFWRCRALRYGNPQAARWQETWLETHPRQRIPCVLPVQPAGGFSGERLRCAGFLLFEPDRDYSLRSPDQEGVVEADSWCDYDPADEDGFGREDYYDWWYLDEHLSALPGVKMLHSYSTQDRRRLPERFQEQYDKAADVIRSRKQ